MTLNIVKHDASFKMADSLSPTIQKVFSDSSIAKLYASGCKKTTCIINGAFQPYFKYILFFSSIN